MVLKNNLSIVSSAKKHTFFQMGYHLVNNILQLSIWPEGIQRKGRMMVNYGHKQRRTMRDLTMRSNYVHFN